MLPFVYLERRFALRAVTAFGVKLDNTNHGSHVDGLMWRQVC